MGAVEDFLKDPFRANISLTPPAVSPSGLERKVGVGVRGATLGLAGTKPETLGESLIEMAGSLAPIAGISAIAGPAVGAATRAAGLELGPAAARMAGGFATGATTGAISEGTVTGALETGALFTGLEGGVIGAGRVLSKLRGRGKPTLEKPSPITETEAPAAALSIEGARKAEIESITRSEPDLPIQTEFPFKGALPSQSEFKFQNLYGPKISSEAKSSSISDMAKARSLLENEESKTLEQVIADRKQAADLLRGSSRDRITLRDIAVDETGSRLSIAPKDVPVHFEVKKSPGSGMLVFRPLTPEADQALRDLTLHDRQIPLQLGPEQLSFFDRMGQGLKQFMDVVTRQEAGSTTAISQMAEGEAEGFINRVTIPVSEVATLNKSINAALVDMLIKKSDVDSKVVEDIIQTVDQRLGITGLTGVQMKDKIADIERAADHLGLTGSQRTVFIKNEMIARGLQKEGKLKAGPTRTALRKRMILEELNKRCGVSTSQIVSP